MVKSLPSQDKLFGLCSVDTYDREDATHLTYICPSWTHPSHPSVHPWTHGVRPSTHPPIHPLPSVHLLVNHHPSIYLSTYQLKYTLYQAQDFFFLFLGLEGLAVSLAIYIYS